MSLYKTRFCFWFGGIPKITAKVPQLHAGRGFYPKTILDELHFKN